MAAAAPALFERYPELRDRVAWRSLGRFPTPVQPLDLDAGDAWVKRDDLSGELYGGNKVRKLEFLLGDALAAGSRRLITIGAAGSHHALATTVYGRSQGLPASLALFPQPRTEHACRVLRSDAAWGADVHWAPHMSLLPLSVMAARWAHRGDRPYMVPGGGSNRLGTLGYVSGALELAAQIEAGELPEPARVHVPGGTLGTAAGLALGFALAGLRPELVITRVVSPAVTNERRMERLVHGAAALMQEAGVVCPPARDVLARVRLDPAQLGPGYGHATDAGRRAAARFEDAGLVLEPTYTAKAAASLLAGVASSSPVLFWNTFSCVHPLPPPGAAPARLPRGARRWLAEGS